MPPISRFIKCGRRRYYSPAAFSLVEETGIGDPVRAVERLANELLTEAEVEVPPVPLRRLASLVGVVDISEVAMKQAARVRRAEPHGFLIEVRAEDDPGRRNFSIAHDIGHLLIPSYHGRQLEVVDGATGQFLQEHEEEFFCDVAARSLLLPEVMFRAECGRLIPSADHLAVLATTFACSVEAVALRVDQLSVWNCVPVIWEMGLKPAQARHKGDLPLLGMEALATPQEEFRAKFHAGSEETLFFPKHKHVAADSPIVLGCLSDGCFAGDCTLDTGKRVIPCRVDARLLPYRDGEGQMRQRILSLVFPEV